MKKKNKYAYATVIQFRYGGLPWEDVSEYRTTREKKNVMRDLKESYVWLWTVSCRRKEDS